MTRRGWRARSASELRRLLSDPAPDPFAGRDFARSDRLLLRVAPWGSAARDAEVTAQLVGPRGTTLAQLPIHAAVDAVQLIAGAPEPDSWHTLREFQLGTT